ncbi:MAG TPA: aconitase family protein, partial [Rhodothermales bacterium]|nr:aconitase family protein [Rhodothermales bacterium]
GTAYDVDEEIDLSTLEPLIALPSSPGKVVPVREVAGREIYQSYIGSSANPGFRDFAIAAHIVQGRQVHDRVSFDVNPTSRQILENLAEQGYLQMLIRAGARIHQAGCNGCIGMGQAPATNRISLRTVPRNFPGRSGTREDAVYLCSPETAAASALTGQITDPRELGGKFGIKYVQPREPETIIINQEQLVPPPLNGEDFELEKGPNIASLPDFEPLPDTLEGPVLLKLGDDVSTDEIMPAGARVLPFRSNIPEISRFVFSQIDSSFYERTQLYRKSGSFVVGGENYGQGSSREHAAIAPRYLGLRVVIAKSFARIHLRNLANFGILGLTFVDPRDHEAIEQGDTLALRNLRQAIENDGEIKLLNLTRDETYWVRHSLTSGQKASVLAGSLIDLVSDL